MKVLHLIPAYGWDYKSKAVLLEDWNNNKDFQISGIDPNSGRYVNKQQTSDLIAEGYTNIIFRYYKLQRILSIKL